MLLSFFVVVIRAGCARCPGAVAIGRGGNDRFPPIHQVHNCSSCTRRGENLIVELGIYQTKRHPVSGCLVEVDVVVDPADFRRGRDAVAI